MATSPLYNFPHTEVVINDNTQTAAVAPVTVNGTRIMSVFQSPRGVDNKIQAITTGVDEFVEKNGMGPVSKYGQPLLNAYNAVNTNVVTLYGLRVMPKDAARANLHVYAAYKIDVAPEDESQPWNAGGAKMRMTVKFITTSTASADQIVDDVAMTAADLTKIGTGSPAETLLPTVEGFTVKHLFSVACTGRGTYGNTIAVRIISNTRGDKGNKFKNYTFEVLENNEIAETINVCFYDDAIVGDENRAADVMINDTVNGLENIEIGVNYEGFYEIVDKYNTEVAAPLMEDTTAMEAYAKYLNYSTKPNKGVDLAKEKMTLTIEDFDVLLGINKKLSTSMSDATLVKIVNYDVAPSDSTGANPVINLNETAGTRMTSGAEGAYTEDPGKSLEAAYLAAFNGETDPDIRSRNKFPTDVMFDADYPVNVKIAMAAMCIARGDCVCYLDCGTELVTKNSPLEFVSAIDVSTVNRLISVDGYQCKVKDPYSKRIVDVSATCLLSFLIPEHFANYNGKHIPFAGGRYGQMSGYIPGTVYPAYDEDIDAEFMSALYDARVNYAQINPKSVVTRATQQTRQDITSNLSELSNMHIILDIKRDCENLVALYNYNFLNAKELAAFNKDAEELLRKYSDTQVEAISATFSSTDLEEEQGILHLYVDVRQKKLIKTAMIDINVNK